MEMSDSTLPLLDEFGREIEFDRYGRELVIPDPALVGEEERIGAGAYGVVSRTIEPYDQYIIQRTDGLYGTEFVVKVQRNLIKYENFIDELRIYKKLTDAVHIVPILQWMVGFEHDGGEIFYIDSHRSYVDSRGRYKAPLVELMDTLFTPQEDYELIEMSQIFPLFHGTLDAMEGTWLHRRRAPREKMELCYQLAFGIDQMHRRKLVHYDLHSGNVLYRQNPDGSDCYLAIHDFGRVVQMENLDDEDALYRYELDVAGLYAKDIYQLASLMVLICTGCYYITFDQQDVDDQIRILEFKSTYTDHFYDMIQMCFDEELTSRDVLLMTGAMLEAMKYME